MTHPSHSATLRELTGINDAPNVEIDELDLVERAKVDRDAFGILYRTHAPRIHSYLRRRLGNESAAEDVLADTFCRALSSIGRFRTQGVAFRYWLYRIATNLANSKIRKRRLSRLVFGGIVGDEFPSQAKPSSSASADDAGGIRAAMARLDAGDQSILILRFVEELSIKEVANIINCNVGTVQSRTARATQAKSTPE